MLGWIGNVFLLVGLWQVGNKIRSAFLFSAIGEFIWTAHAYRANPRDWALASICFVFAIMAVRSWWKWGKDEQARA